MARLPRYDLPGIPQHVIQRGNNRSRMFVAESDFWTFRNCLRTACHDHDCRIHAYVLMTNHVHLVMTPGYSEAIGKVMQSVGRGYVRYFNDATGRTGGLWEGRYRATVIDSDGYLLACYRYVELNPVRAGMVTCPGDYPWSSYRANSWGHPDDLVSPHEQYAALGRDPAARRSAYRDLVATGVEESTLDQIRAATHKGWALGSVTTHRRGRPLARGRRANINGV